MRLRHFQALNPICPVCAAANRASPLSVGTVVRQVQDDILEGVLLCSEPFCQREYPILDGIPVIVANLRSYVSDQLLGIYARQDVSPVLESLLGDCCGPQSSFDQLRQQLSIYAWDHYGEGDPDLAEGAPQPGSMLRCLEVGQQLAAPLPAGPLLDVGCAVGRSSLALASGGEELVLGIDLNFAMLRLASEVLRRGVVRYSRRRVGVVYDRREFPVAFPQADRVDFWACDAAAPPFPPGRFALALAMNVLDCSADPAHLLAATAQLLRPAGKLILTTPYDWSPHATPFESWLGGHSQRAHARGASETVLRDLLLGGDVGAWKPIAEQANLSWWVRLHDRSAMHYRVHLVVAEKSHDRGSR